MHMEKRLNTTNYPNRNFLSTIMSGVKKGSDERLERLKPSDMPALEAWYRKNIKQRALGKDQQQSAEPLDTKPDIFTEVLRLSATKRTLFFINYNGEVLAAADEFITDCLIWLEAQQKTLLEGACSLTEDLFNKGLELLREDQLFIIFRPEIDEYLVSSPIYGEFLKKYEDLASKRKAILHSVQQPGFNLSHECQRPCEEYLVAYEDFISQRKLLEKAYLDARPTVFHGSEFVGLGPLLMKEGDEIYILAGSRSPLVLRPMIQAYPRTAPQTYQLLGDCYIDGAMDGDAIPMGTSIVDFIDSLDPHSEPRRSDFSLGAAQSGTATLMHGIVTLEIV